jgi:peptidoglycan/LPS O-acetylase OafA/YrhL
MNRNLSFDLIRGISALLVCASHLRNGLLVDYGQVHDPNPMLTGFYFVTGLGHQAVMVFFVLSGYFVGGSILARLGQFSWVSYAQARLSRLWMVLLPALVFTVMMDAITNHFSPEAISGEFAPIWNSGPTGRQDWSVSSVTFIGNILFMQTVVVPVLGTNQPLWSLANEFWYYVLFPVGLVLLGLTRHNSIFQKLLAAVVVLLAVIYLPLTVWAGFPIWLLGVIIWKMPQMAEQFKVGAFTLATIILVTTLYISKKGMINPWICDLLVGMAFTALAATLRNKTSYQMKARWMSRLSVGVSEISYSLYLFHFPVIIAVGGCLYKGQQMQPNVCGLLQFGLWFVVIIIGATTFWWLFEKRTDCARRWLVENTSKLRHCWPTVR